MTTPARANRLNERKRSSFGSEISAALPISTVNTSPLRDRSPPVAVKADRSREYSPFDESRLKLSQLTVNDRIARQLRNKIIHRFARREFDQNSTSEEQLRSFKILQLLQKHQTGKISPLQRQKYGSLIKAVDPFAFAEKESMESQ